MRDELAQPWTQPQSRHHNHHPTPHPTYTHNRRPPNSGTLTEISALEEECIRQQAEWLAIEDEANRTAREGRELGGKQQESRREESEDIEWQPEEMGEAGEDELERHRDETRRAPTYPVSDPDPKPTTGVYKVPYELHVVATSLYDDSINHQDTPNPATNSLPPSRTHDPAPATRKRCTRHDERRRHPRCVI
jgi:hypothetical protein